MIAQFIKYLILPIAVSVPLYANAQDVSISRTNATPASPLTETTHGRCGDREISFTLERLLSRHQPRTIKVAIEVGASRNDLTETSLGRDLQQTDLAMRYFILCRADGFSISGFGFGLVGGENPSGFRLLASFDDAGKLISNTGLIPETTEVISHGLD